MTNRSLPRVTSTVSLGKYLGCHGDVIWVQLASVSYLAETLLKKTHVGLHLYCLESSLQLLHSYPVVANMHITADDMRQQGKAPIHGQMPIPNIQHVPCCIISWLGAASVLENARNTCNMPWQRSTVHRELQAHVVELLLAFVARAAKHLDIRRGTAERTEATRQRPTSTH